MKRKKITKAKLIALLVAAAIALTGCTLYMVFKREIDGFIEHIYETYIYVDNDSEERTIIEDAYQLSYVPDGFEQYYEIITPNMISYKWEKDNGNKLKFTQMPSYAQSYIDNPNGFAAILEYNDIKIYHQAYETSHTYIWRTDKYYFQLVSNVYLDEKELIKILDGMMISE